MLAGCASLGNVDDEGRVYREAIDAPVHANLEPLAGEPSIRILRDPIPARGAFGSGGDEGESSACEAEHWQQLIGMTMADAQAQDLPDATRIVEWGGMVTQDYVPSRMNVHLDQNGRVYRVICG
jgi:hypothetical protein